LADVRERRLSCAEWGTTLSGQAEGWRTELGFPDDEDEDEILCRVVPLPFGVGCGLAGPIRRVQEPDEVARLLGNLAGRERDGWAAGSRPIGVRL